PESILTNARSGRRTANPTVGPIGHDAISLTSMLVEVDDMNSKSAPAIKFVAYLRVSTARGGASGPGLDAQRESVRQVVDSRGSRIIAPEIVEVESGKVNA